MSPFLILLALIVFVGLFFAVVSGLDRARIRNYVAVRGGKVVFIRWTPFGHGWFGEKDSRIYKVRFMNGEGAVVEANCKTGMFSGVYFNNESVIHRTRTGSAPSPAAVVPEPDADASLGVQGLMEENRLLREENRRLREELERRR